MGKFTVLIFTLLAIIATRQIGSLNAVRAWEKPEVIYPEDNPFSEASIKLGDALFFETLLSKDSSISCQSCHLTTEALADHLPIGEGIKGRHVTRNTPTLLNIGLHPYFMADGKFKTLEEQVLGPINEHREFDMSPEEVVARLKTIPLYNKLSLKAYDQELTIKVIQKALANFERILISDNSRFDQFMRGESELTDEEMTGWKLFNNSKLNCIQCHSGYNFTNFAFENNGLYKTYQDSGRALITKQPEDLAKFKVPSLRNIAITYPYMHNGSMNSLEEVIDHYSAGGKGHVSQSELIKGFEINPDEKKALIAFLKTLTEERYLQND
jgi:cytochrome c peroxidase